MPLLDPDQQFYFSIYKSEYLDSPLRKNQVKSTKASFFLKYLPYASQYLQQNIKTMEIHPVFKIEFLKNINYINQEFKLNLPPSQEISKLNINDYFRYFYEYFQEKGDNMTGNYLKLLSNTKLYEFKAKLKCFQPNIGSHTHCWHFLEYSVAILSLNDSSIKMLNDSQRAILHLEICLLKSLGFTLVLCLYLNSEVNCSVNLLNLFKTKFFSEIHVNIDSNLSSSKKELHKIVVILEMLFRIQKVESNSKSLLDIDFYGYFYLYISYSKELNEQNPFSQLKSIPYFKCFYYSLNLTKSFKKIIPKKLPDDSEFAYCNVGFDCPMVRVYLCKVPLYEQEFEEDCQCPSKISQLTYGYVDPEEFLAWKGSRVEVLFPNDTISYVDFNDLHVMKPEFFVSSTLHLMKADKEMVEELEKIDDKSKQEIKKYNQNADFILKNISTFLKSKEAIVEKGLSYLAYAVNYMRGFSLHRNQLFGTYHALLSCIGDESKEGKGIIYQLETGEGKSIIIQVIASHLVKIGKKVHIATSNIHLATRDFSDSCDFFNKLDIESAVLLHQNEIPNPDDERLKGKKLNVDYSKFTESALYTDDKFDNSLNMNFNVCGVGNDNKPCPVPSKLKVIFSTFINFEALYLKMMETWSPKSVKDYFNDHYLIVDEADTILIDELSNGTILSRTLNSNAAEVLTFIYQCKMGQLSAENLSKIIDVIYKSLPTREKLENTYTKFAEELKNELIRAEEKEAFSIADNSKGKSKTTVQINPIQNVVDTQKILNFIFLNTFCRISPFNIRKLFKKVWPNLNDDEEEFNLTVRMYNEIRRSNRDLLRKQSSIKFSFKEDKMVKLIGFLCRTFLGNPSVRTLLNLVKKIWPQCEDLGQTEIRSMFTEIELVHTPEFINGRRYLIEKNRNPKGMEMKVKKKKKKKNKKVAKFFDGVSKVFNVFGVIEEKIKDKMREKKEKEEEEPKMITIEEKEQLITIEQYFNELKEKNVSQVDVKKEEKKVEEEEDEEEIDEAERLEVYPYDYDNKGILEKNKEFSGYIQQFIAIKEKLNYPEKYRKLKVRDLSVNYLYVSHPIFAQLYKRVCGFTGTVGRKPDKDIFKEQYFFKTFKIPRDKPNHRVELPMILCEDSNERNHFIFEEVVAFHEQNIPVLVVLRDLNDLNTLKEYFENHFYVNINVFNGTDVSISPEEVAGLNGAISLGTNFCGRGTDIKFKQLPLHVIVAYYSTNSRAMNQAFGRTARNGSEGTCRVICTADEYIRPTELITKESMNDVLRNYSIKKEEQANFISHYRKRFNWLFDHDFKHSYKDTRISGEDAAKLKESRINVNRITACSFKYPVGMSIGTFLNIQAQKAYSLYNCPNCMYTWLLFQRYMREMILESWSMMVDKAEMDYFYSSDPKIRECTFKEFLLVRIKELKSQIDLYLPITETPEIFKCYMSIHDRINGAYTEIIDRIFDDKLLIRKKTGFSNFSFLSINFGFMPFSLLDNSGSRIENFDGDAGISYIKDPELSYLQQLGDGKPPILFSITSKIDDLFNLICQKINQIIGGYIGLRFFMRRTIAGCEFGICLDLSLINKDFSSLGPNCMIDKDPLMLFTLHVKSLGPILAGVLVILLVYVAKLCTLIIQGGIPILGKTLIKETLFSVVSFLAEHGLESQIAKVFQLIIALLAVKLKQQIDDIEKFDIQTAQIFRVFATVFALVEVNDNISEKISDRISKKLGKSFKIKGRKVRFFEMIFPHIFKLAVVLIMNLVAFVMNFQHNREIKCKSKFDVGKVAEEYNGKNADKALEENEEIVEKIYVPEDEPKTEGS